MKKLKKIYCSISLAFGTVTLLLALFCVLGKAHMRLVPMIS